MKIDKIDYKGKHFILQDKGIYYNEDIDIVVGETTKEKAMDKAFVRQHKKICQYYGIPCYIGEDEELRKIYK